VSGCYYAPTNPMKLRFEPVADVQVVVVESPRIDAHASAALKSDVAARLPGHAHLILDLSAVDFVDSSGLAAFLSLMKRLPPTGQLILCGCSAPIRDILALTRLDRIFDVVDGVYQALTFLGAGRE